MAPGTSIPPQQGALAPCIEEPQHHLPHVVIQHQFVVARRHVSPCDDRTALHAIAHPECGADRAVGGGHVLLRAHQNMDQPVLAFPRAVGGRSVAQMCAGLKAESPPEFLPGGKQFRAFACWVAPEPPGNLPVTASSHNAPGGRPPRIRKTDTDAGQSDSRPWSRSGRPSCPSAENNPARDG